MQTVDVAPGQYLIGPLIALLAVGLLMLVSRFAWTPSGRRRMRDYGLLVSVLTVPDVRVAQRARDLLVESGIRATLGEAQAVVFVSAQGREQHQPAGQHVLVFPADLDRARALLAA